MASGHSDVGYDSVTCNSCTFGKSCSDFNAIANRCVSSELSSIMRELMIVEDMSAVSGLLYDPHEALFIAQYTDGRIR